MFTWFFAAVETEAKGLGEGHSHWLADSRPQEGGQTRRLGGGGGGAAGVQLELTSGLQVVVLRLQVLNYGLSWAGDMHLDVQSVNILSDLWFCSLV